MAYGFYGGSQNGFFVNEDGDCGAGSSIPTIRKSDIHKHLNQIYSLTANQGISDSCWKANVTANLRFLSQFQNNTEDFTHIALLNSQNRKRVVLYHTYLNGKQEGGSEAISPQGRIFGVHHALITDNRGMVRAFGWRRETGKQNVICGYEAIDGDAHTEDCVAQYIQDNSRATGHGSTAQYYIPALAPAGSMNVDMNRAGIPGNIVNLGGPAGVNNNAGSQLYYF